MKLPFNIPWWVADLVVAVVSKLLPIPPWLKIALPFVFSELKKLPAAERKVAEDELKAAAVESRLKGDISIFTHEVHKKARMRKRQSDRAIAGASDTVGLD